MLFTEFVVNPVDVLVEDVNVVVDIPVVSKVDDSCVVGIKLVSAVDMEVLAVVLLHLPFCRIQNIINMHIICVYDDLLRRRC